MKNFTRGSLFLNLLLIFPLLLSAQKINDSLFTSGTFSGLEFRNIGPAFMSGRIADIAIHPSDRNIWYVAVGSGGIWKTENSGTTWQPLFDKEDSYSTGCITIDPTNPHTVWVGTGENVGGRHVGYGDGVYKSNDDGKTWRNMGLKASEHISKIIVHPENPDIVWVAAQGPLWSKGGERGLYKTVDGGKTWKKTLGDEAWTGVTDIAIDPHNPDRLYAATWQRQRNVAAYMGGGPGSGIYRSEDGGESWEKLTEGLPDGDMGKIGLAISPQKPDVVYAVIELNRRSGAFYRSENRGSSWKKMSETVAGGTGPHYYNELYASPHQFDKVYLADVRFKVTDDGGKTFSTVPEKDKHSDNHALAFIEDEPGFLLAGTDGGLYVSHDGAKNWRFIPNLPVTQIYKLALDDAKPFYNVYGGTQDNSTQGGPSRTDNSHGIRNADWSVILYADGYQTATEPGNPDIVYAEWQEGNLVRVDRSTGEVVYIQPQPAEGEDYERYNWDAPILVSLHQPTRLYYASQRVWRSDNRGDSWTPVSGDLTRNQERIELPIMGKTWGWDAAWDVNAMSNFNTITSLAESPVQEGLIWAGTDDGLLQVTTDGGENWRRIEAGDIPGIPASAFVNDIKADLYDAQTVYVAFDNHKYGDMQPYLVKSTDLGKHWTSIRGNLPDRTLVWRLVQDHQRPELLFAGTEFGIYFTIDGGQQWTLLSGGVPTIAFRDLAIQRRENDLVGASFGRGFFILDDYSPLRQVTKEQLRQEATLFPTRKAWWYMPRPVVSFGKRGSQGADYYIAPNPPFGAVFTYYLSESLTTKKQERQKAEKKLREAGKDIPFPGWEAVEAERRQDEPQILLTVTDQHGNVVRRLEGPAKKGFHRVAWDLRYPAVNAVTLNNASSKWEPEGFMAAPGTYTVSLSKVVDGKVTALSGPVDFEVVKMREGALPGAPPEEVAAFWREIDTVRRATSAAGVKIRQAQRRIAAIEKALSRSTATPGTFDERIHHLKQQLYALEEQMYGNPSKREIGEKTRPTVGDRLGAASTATSNSTYGPTPMARRSLELAKKQFAGMRTELNDITENQIPALEKELMAAGAPWIEGQPVPED